MWVVQSQDDKLPHWLTANLANRCECGWEMENFYNDAGDITARRCSNPSCPYRMAQRVVGMCEILGIKGVGEKTAYKTIQQYKLKSHLEAIPFIIREKPEIDLYTFMQILFVKGISTGWASVVDKYQSLDELLKKYNGKFAWELQEREDEIRNGAELVKIKEAQQFEFEPLIRGTVMISGNIKGWTNRNNFIAALNQSSKGLIQLGIAESKRKTGVMALIQEADTPNRGKAECALENGIPILTPQEFQTKILSELKSKLGRR